MENDTTNENIDSTNDTETVETESTGTETESADTSSESEVDVAKLQETNKRLFERAKKAEAELKASKANKPGAVKTEQQTSPVDVDERILKSQGMADDLLSELKVIAKIRGVSLIDAQKDSLFVAVKEKFEKDTRVQKASMGASRGSGTVKPKVTADTPGLSREDHMRIAKEALAK